MTSVSILGMYYHMHVNQSNLPIGEYIFAWGGTTQINVLKYKFSSIFVPYLMY